MSIDVLETVLQEFETELFLYSWEIFELRIQEEMLRADRTGAGFGYLELPFARIRAMIRPEIEERELWLAIFRFLSETMRGSDIKGFLSANAGVGLVFLDATPQGVMDCRERLWLRLENLGWLVPLARQAEFEAMKLTFYPLETTV